MKFLLYALIFILLPFKSFSQQHTDSLETKDGAKMHFEEMEFDFGDIYQGDKVEHTFEFINIGSAPLIINNVLTTCGCTAPEWPRDPISPGNTGTIKVLFNSVGKMGRQNKVITIRSNSVEPDHRLKIVAMVLPPQKSKDH